MSVCLKRKGEKSEDESLWYVSHNTPYWFLTELINRICEAKPMKVDDINDKPPHHIETFTEGAGWAAERPDCRAVIWLERRAWRDSVMWNVLWDRDRRDFSEGKSQAQEGSGREVTRWSESVTGGGWWWLLRLATTCTQTEAIPEWTRMQINVPHIEGLLQHGMTWNMSISSFVGVKTAKTKD